MNKITPKRKNKNKNLKRSIKPPETQIMTKIPLNMWDDHNTPETSKITEIEV